MSNPWLNAEGYNDPTAYEAIRNMEENRMKANEVWVVQGPSNTEITVVVLAVHKTYCSTIILCDEEPVENSCSVIAGGKTYSADLGRLGFYYSDRFIRKAADLGSKQAESFRYAIAATLGLENTNPGAQSSDTEALKTQVVRYKTEATIYQDLYDRLLERVITKG